MEFSYQTAVRSSTYSLQLGIQEFYHCGANLSKHQHITRVVGSLVPRPHSKIGKGAWCHLQKFPYVPSQHITQLILIITLLRHRLVTFITCKCSKESYNWQWMKIIPLLQTKTTDTAHTGIFASNTRPLSRFFWVGPGDEANWWVGWLVSESDDHCDLIGWLVSVSHNCCDLIG